MITGEQLGGLLFSIHHHEEGDPDRARIIYYEDDLLKVFKAIGLPEPIWGKSIKVEHFKMSNPKKKSRKK